MAQAIQCSICKTLLTDDGGLMPKHKLPASYKDPGGGRKRRRVFCPSSGGTILVTKQARMAHARFGRTSAQVSAARALFLREMNGRNADLLVDSAAAAATDANLVLDGEPDVDKLKELLPKGSFVTLVYDGSKPEPVTGHRITKLNGPQVRLGAKWYYLYVLRGGRELLAEWRAA